MQVADISPIAANPQILSLRAVFSVALSSDSTPDIDHHDNHVTWYAPVAVLVAPLCSADTCTSCDTVINLPNVRISVLIQCWDGIPRGSYIEQCLTVDDASKRDHQVAVGHVCTWCWTCRR
jgi:hypothetical protein